MSFLAPIWLWAAAAIVVPTLIHLLARGRGRVVDLGTVRFLPEAQSRRLRHLRPTGLLRYLLRASLLAALALALAAPRWWRADVGPATVRWALVDPVLVSERDRLERSAPELYAALDAVPQGERRWLAPGLPPESGSVEKGSPADLWSILSEAAAMLPASATLEVFTLDRTSSLRGMRPSLPQSVVWQSLSDPEPNRWIQRLMPAADGLVVTLGSSDARGTTFTTATVTPDDLAQLGLLETGPEGSPSLMLVDGGAISSDDRAALPPTPEPLYVSVAAGAERRANAAAVRRAAAAVATHLGRPLVLGAAAVGAATPSANASTAPTLDLRVTLGGAGATTATPPARVALEDGEGGEPCRQTLWNPTLPDPRLRLRRCAGTGAASGGWYDGWGNAMLTSTRRPGGVDYQWHGRFDPGWSSLVESGLPHLLLELVAPGDDAANGAANAMSDRRAAPAGHARPRPADEPERRVPDPLPERIAWGLVALLFALDRLLVRRLA